MVKVATTPKKATAPKKQVSALKPKRYGAINEHDELHEIILADLKKLALDSELVNKMLTKFMLNLFIHAPEQFPEWDIDKRHTFGEFFLDYTALLETVGKYDWTGKTFPKLSKQDAWSIYNRFTIWIRLKREETQKLIFEWAKGAAEITLFFAQKHEGEIGLQTVADSLKVQDLLIDIFLSVQEAEDFGELQQFRDRTEAVVNGSHLESNGPKSIEKGTPIRLKYFNEWDNDKPLLRVGDLVAVASTDTDKGKKKYFSIGWLMEYERGEFIKLSYTNATVTITSEEIDAIYRAEVITSKA